MQVRNATSNDLSAIADIWFEGWHSGHAQYAPAELTALRTHGDFLRRIATYLSNTRILASEDGRVLAFHIFKDDEVYQFYVSAQSRGQGAAARLMADAEACLKQAGIATAWLACAVGNDRAARFYEKSGWTRARVETENVETSSGSFPLQVWRYEKQLD